MLFCIADPDLHQDPDFPRCSLSKRSLQELSANFKDSQLAVSEFPRGLCIETRSSAQPLTDENDIHSHANKTHYHKKGCALGLTLKVRTFGTRSGLLSTFSGFELEPPL